MRVLVTWGSKRGGTEGIARIIGEALREAGFDVELLSAHDARKATQFDAAIIGGALYANRWHPDARRFVRQRQRTLQRVPVWFFSSGPLDDSADQRRIPPTRQVEQLMARVGAQGHATFGGRLAPDARGLIAAAIAKKHAGDWRNEGHIRAWTAKVADALPKAMPPLVTAPGHSFDRLALHAFIGWATCSLIMGVFAFGIGTPAATVIHALAAPLVFAAVSTRYFAPAGAREPLPTALAFVAIVILLDAVIVAAFVQHSFAMFGSVAQTWLPLLLIFLATWMTGNLHAMRPTTLGPRIS
jgi:menaquinone-dependent protoporphyrinogen oxidase